jgi:hypothetical protein
MIVSAVSSGSCSAVTPETQSVVKPATNDGDVDNRASAAAPRVNDGDADDRAAYSSAVSRSSGPVQSALTELASGK